LSRNFKRNTNGHYRHEKCSISLSFSKMKISITLRFHLSFSPVRMAIMRKQKRINAGKDEGWE
jgi:hypothetical protein